jgi:hypothetical protein
MQKTRTVDTCLGALADFSLISSTFCEVQLQLRPEGDENHEQVISGR